MNAVDTNQTESETMNPSEIKSAMAVFSWNGKSYECGFGLYDFRHDHNTATFKAAELWCATENRKLASIA